MNSQSAKWQTLVIGTILALTLGASRAAAQAPDGATLYRENCRSCHGATGVAPQRMRTVYKTIPNLDSAFLAKRSEDSVAAVIRNGAGRDMKGFKDKLTADEILAIAKHVRGFAAPAPKTP